MPENVMAWTRRKFLTSVAATAAIGACATAAHATLIAPFDYELTGRDVFIKNLPSAFDGFRITQVTDIHHSSLVPLEEVRRVVEIARDTAPDMFALTGDFTTHDKHERLLEPCAELLATLAAPCGVWAVTGNHDHTDNPQRVVETLRRHRIEVLYNQNTGLTHKGDALQLAGIADRSWAATDWIKARRGLDFARPAILLSHQPYVFDEAESREYDLILAGHTHGGQVSLPIIGAPVRFMEQFRYVSGLFTRGRTQLYVSRGTGVIGLPVRFGARPEIAVIRLRSC